ncbi:MAG: hypothetical protein K0M55_02640 [Rhizobium sp.]|nr:hypothetical protein [Rhizobium sp.]MBW8320277.1 hypothetical protein [Rhizobium sp.]
MKVFTWMVPFVMAIAGTGSVSAGGSPVLYCESPATAENADVYRAVCAEVASEFRLKYPLLAVRDGAAADKPDGDVIRLDIIKVDRHAIAGRLAWSGRKTSGAGYVLGPVITTTISDADLNTRTLQEFARGLVMASKIQFPKS